MRCLALPKTFRSEGHLSHSRNVAGDVAPVRAGEIAALVPAKGEQGSQRLCVRKHSAAWSDKLDVHSKLTSR